MTLPDRNNVCGKPTKKGTACRASLHSWLEGLEVRRADGCWTHMDAAFREAAEARKRRDEEAWQAYLDADPICWSWPVPDGLDNWTYPQGSAIDEQLPGDVLADLLGHPESRASVILYHWQDGRCAICGHRRDLVEDHDHRTGLVRGYLCRGCNTQEGVYGSCDSLFGRYRQRHPTSMLGLRIRYWDPIANEYAPSVERQRGDPWTDAASEDIGL
jgi:hypothetical protein